MRSILVLYMTGMLAMSESDAVEVAHLFLAGIYILPLLGAWIADRFLGRYRTILYISLFYCLGHGVLATADLTESIEMRRYILFLGLFIIALGAGGIKPCVSAFVGDQVPAGEKDSTTLTANITLQNPQSWSYDIPAMYKAHIRLITAEEIADYLQIPFGIKTVEYDPYMGLVCNDESPLVQGSTMDYNGRLTGYTAFRRAEALLVEHLQTNGYTAVRCPM
jgi:hypothetical protein